MTSEYESAGYDTRTPSSSSDSGSPFQPIIRYFQTLKALLTGPTQFFRDLPRPVSIATPLLFGIITNWIGSALEYLWYAGLGKAFETRIADIMDAFQKTAEIDSTGQTRTLLAMQEKFTGWAFGVGAVLVDPFFTCLKILFLAFFIWLAARLFASLAQSDIGERLSYESAVSIVGYSLAASIFKGIPLLGGLIAGVFAMAISVIGASQTYRVGTGRAILIALFPMILLWSLVIAGFIAFFSAIALLFLR